MPTQTLTTLTAEAKQYYDRLLLERALPVMLFYKAGQQRNIPKNNGNQVSYRRFNSLALAKTPLTEGVTPANVNLSITEITGTVQQYGNWLELSDQIDMMGIDPVIRETVTLVSENAGQSVDSIVGDEVVGGTSVIYGTGSARNAQSSANPLTLSMVHQAVRNLESNNAPKYMGSRSEENGQGGKYIGLIHPRQFYDLKRDTTVTNMFVYSKPDGLIEFTLPEIGGVAWMVSTLVPTFAGAGAGGATVYPAIICGNNAFGVVNVAGTGRFSTHAKPLGSSGTADPLDQRSSVGWKSLQLPKRLNESFMTRIETGVTD